MLHDGEPVGLARPSWRGGFLRLKRVYRVFDWRRARYLVGGRRRVRRRLQLGARILRDVGEIGRQSWRPNGRRFGLGSIVVWFGHGVSPRDARLTRVEPRLFR